MTESASGRRKRAIVSAASASSAAIWSITCPPARIGRSSPFPVARRISKPAHLRAGRSPRSGRCAPRPRRIDRRRGHIPCGLSGTCAPCRPSRGEPRPARQSGGRGGGRLPCAAAGHPVRRREVLRRASRPVHHAGAGGRSAPYAAQFLLQSGRLAQSELCRKILGLWRAAAGCGLRLRRRQPDESHHGAGRLCGDQQGVGPAPALSRHA